MSTYITILRRGRNGTRSIAAAIAAAIAPLQPKQLPSYTVATLPAASAANARTLVHVSDGAAGEPCVAISTGAAWKVLAAIGDDVSAGG